MVQQQRIIEDHQYVAINPEYVLKVDGDRPILYPLDYVNTQFYFLKPEQGFALSLLNGSMPFAQIRQMFSHFFPGAPDDALAYLIEQVDLLVRRQPTATGIGLRGVLQIADAPIAHAITHDPREFVVSPSAYAARMRDTKNKYRLDTPINIYTVFTHRCQTNCVYCYAERKKVPELPLARWRELIGEMAQLGIKMCSPDNGDTLARADGVDLLECLIEHDMLFLLSTKAHMGRDAIRRLVDAGFTRPIQGAIQRPVQLSIDAGEDELCMRMLGITKPRLAKMTETFESFLSFGIMPKVKAVITGLNYDQPKRIVDHFYPHGARVFTFVRYHRTFHRHTDSLFVQPEHIPVLKAQFDAIRAQYPDVELHEDLTAGSNDITFLAPELRQQVWENRLGCGGGWFALGIAPDGSAFLCEQMKLDTPYIVGNAAAQSIRQIWQGAQLETFIHPSRERFKGTLCYECEQFEPCIWEKGRCYRDAFFAYGSIYDTPPLCPYNQRPGLRLS